MWMYMLVGWLQPLVSDARGSNPIFIAQIHDEYFVPIFMGTKVWKIKVIGIFVKNLNGETNFFGRTNLYKSIV